MRVDVSEGRLEGAHGTTWYQRNMPERPRPGAAAAGRAPRRPGHGSRLPAPAGRPRSGRPRGHLVRPGRLRTEQPRPGRPAPTTGPSTSYVDELRELVEHWESRDGFHLLGQSWGGMLAPEYVLAHPGRAASLVLMDSPAGMPDWAAGTRRLLADTAGRRPPHDRAPRVGADLRRAGVPRSRRRVLPPAPVPPRPVAPGRAGLFAQLEQDPSVYASMIGPSEFTITGDPRLVVRRRAARGPEPAHAGGLRRARRGHRLVAPVRRPDPRRRGPRVRRDQPHAAPRVPRRVRPRPGDFLRSHDRPTR